MINECDSLTGSWIFCLVLSRMALVAINRGALHKDDLVFHPVCPLWAIGVHADTTVVITALAVMSMGNT